MRSNASKEECTSSLSTQTSGEPRTSSQNSGEVDAGYAALIQT
jgi:hypothetical protein